MQEDWSIDDEAEQDDDWSGDESHASFASLRSTNAARQLERARHDQTMIYYGICRLPRQYWDVRPPLPQFYKLGACLHKMHHSEIMVTLNF